MTPIQSKNPAFRRGFCLHAGGFLRRGFCLRAGGFLWRGFAYFVSRTARHCSAFSS